MRILVIEDDQHKRARICFFFEETVDRCVLSTAKSFQSGLKALLNGIFDLVILDMTMPTFDIDADEQGGRPQAYAGREILRQMDRRKIRIPVILVTQFDRFGEGKDMLTLGELDIQLRHQHERTYAGSVYYDSTSSEWMVDLTEMLLNIGL